MGCDIHMFIEYKAFDEWWEFGKFNTIDRNYGVFGALAGVRGDSEHGFKAKGLPEGMSDGIYESYEDWKGDAHNETWLTPDEFDLAMKDFEKEFGCKPPVDYRAINLILKEFKEDEVEVRAVFWFDN